MKKKHQETVRNFAFQEALAREHVMLGAPGSPFMYNYRSVSVRAAEQQKANLAATGQVLFANPAYSWPLIKHLQSSGKQFTIEHLSNGSVLVSVPKPLPGKPKILGDLLIRVKLGKDSNLLESLTGRAVMKAGDSWFKFCNVGTNTGRHVKLRPLDEVPAAFMSAEHVNVINANRKVEKEQTAKSEYVITVNCDAVSQSSRDEIKRQFLGRYFLKPEGSEGFVLKETDDFKTRWLNRETPEMDNMAEALKYAMLDYTRLEQRALKHTPYIPTGAKRQELVKLKPEKPMSIFKTVTTHFVNDNDAARLSDDELFAQLARGEQQLEKLKAIKTPSKKLEKQVADIQQQLVDLAAYIDSRE